MSRSSLRGAALVEQGCGPIFVVGYMHSGTTLIREVIGRAPDVFRVSGETRFFERLRAYRRRFADIGDPIRLAEFVDAIRDDLRAPGAPPAPGEIESIGAELLDVSEETRHVAVFRRLLDLQAAREGRARWVEKTPGHVHYLDTLLSSIPDARVVEVVRDPRDVLASKKTRRRTVWTTSRYSDAERPRKHLQKAFDPLSDAMAWRAAVQAGAAAHEAHPERVRRVRYEDVVEAPEERVAELCAFLGLQFEPEMLGVEGRNAAGRPTAGGSGIHPDSVGRWRNVLTRGEVAMCQWVTGSTAEACGYRAANLPISVRLVLPALATRSGGEFILRLARRWRLEGAGGVGRVLRSYARRAQGLARRPEPHRDGSSSGSGSGPPP